MLTIFQHQVAQGRASGFLVPCNVNKRTFFAPQAHELAA